MPSSDSSGSTRGSPDTPVTPVTPVTPEWETSFVKWAQNWPTNVRNRVLSLLGKGPTPNAFTNELQSTLLGDPSTGQLPAPFGGILSKLGPKDLLKIAKSAPPSLSPSRIRDATGWQKIHGDWKYEHPDTPNSLDDLKSIGYPQSSLPTIDRNSSTPWAGQFDPQTNRISISPSAPNPQSTVQHEKQHFIQTVDRTPRGSTPDESYQFAHDPAVINKVQQHLDSLPGSNPATHVARNKVKEYKEEKLPVVQQHIADMSAADRKLTNIEQQLENLTVDNVAKDIHAADIREFDKQVQDLKDYIATATPEQLETLKKRQVYKILTAPPPSFDNALKSAKSSFATDKFRLETQKNDLLDEIYKSERQIRQLASPLSTKIYMQQAGEAEARLVQKRSHLSNDDKRMTPYSRTIQQHNEVRPENQLQTKYTSRDIRNFHPALKAMLSQ